MRKLTATLCSTIVALFISATVEPANAEDKFYAYSENSEGTIREIILSIRHKKLTISMSQNCVMCQYPSEMTCEETVIGPKNTFRSYCSNMFAFKRLEGNIEKAELDGGGQSGGAVFHFIHRF